MIDLITRTPTNSLIILQTPHSFVVGCIRGVLSTTAVIVGNVKTVNYLKQRRYIFGLERIVVYPAQKLNTKDNVFN